MKIKSILPILLMFLSIQVNAQVRKPQRSETIKLVKFEFKAGRHTIETSNPKSTITIEISRRNSKILSITRNTKKKSYQLKRADKNSCNSRRPCYIGCWKDPITSQYIRVGKNCNQLAEEDELNGQIEFLGPDL